MPEAGDLCTLFERFHRAGWITGFTESDGAYDLNYTPLGRQRVDSLVLGFKDIRESGFEFTSLAAGETRDCVAELIPPKLSQKEFMALLGFIKSFRMD